MELIFTDVKSVLFMLLAVVALAVLSIVGYFLVIGLRKLMAKLGIQLTDAQIESVKGVVISVVKFLNQKLVSALKNANPDGKLTNEQKDEVFQKAVQLITRTLTDDQKKVLETKFGDIDTAMEIMVESAVADNHVSANEIKVLTGELTTE